METEAQAGIAESPWLSFAAYVTWLALGLLAAINIAWDRDLVMVERVVGGLAAGGTIGLGFLFRWSCATDRRLWWRWWSIGLQSVLALTSIWVLSEATLAVFLIIIASLAAESGNMRATILWLVLVNLGLAAVLFTIQRPIQASISFPLYLGFQLFAFAMNNAVTSERRTREQLAGVNAELLATRMLLQESVRNEERLRISRELHDVAGHRLTALKLNLRALMTRGEPDAERVELCHDLSDELLADIRSVVHQLRATDEIDVPGALSLLKHQHPGTTIHLDVDEGIGIDGIEIAEAIVRSTQEAITNALKHGRASEVWVTLGQDSNGITLSVRDDGAGGEIGEGGHGLVGMSERAELLGGALEVEPSSERGWILRLTFPLGATA